MWNNNGRKERSNVQAQKSSGKRKKSGKCPESLNTMIDLAADLTMTAIASSQEKKHNYSARGKINPYAATAVGMATGRIKNTEDIIRTGAILGAMESFDDDDTCDDPLLFTDSFIHTNDNRYAWWLNCMAFLQKAMRLVKSIMKLYTTKNTDGVTFAKTVRNMTSILKTLRQKNNMKKPWRRQGKPLRASPMLQTRMPTT
ncbi:MAG: hypothetical protein LUD19_03290 [Clostridia bacterium]|nr:hypothetical protein [Clostridia bacterium]